MKKSDYLQKLDKAQNPYYYWILENEEPILSKSDLEDDFLVFLSADGDMEEHALSYIRDYLDLQLQDGKINVDLIYCDEDVLLDHNAKDIARSRTSPWLKPDWSPDTLDSMFYFGGLVLVRRPVAEKVSHRIEMEPGDFLEENGYYRLDKESYDFLRECAKESRNVLHIPRILFHSRKPVRYEYETPRFVETVYSCVSVIILSKDHPELLRNALRAVEIGGEGQKIETIVVDNGSTQENRKSIEQLKQEFSFRYLYQPMEFQYSTLCNLGAAEAEGDFLLFLNDDVELVGPIRFISRMLAEAAKSHIGAVGLKLLYPGGDLIQHIGITDLACGPSHKLATYPDSVDYDHGRNHITGNVLAVTGACMMMEKRKFYEVSGFDEKLAVAYTDVDLCVDLIEKGYWNVCINEIFLYHHESISRGNDMIDDGKRTRLQKERDYFYAKHPFIQEKGDPFYHPQLTKTKLTYEPDFLQEWEYTDRLSLPVEMEGKKVKKVESNRFHCNIDAIRLMPGQNATESDYAEMEGWAFYSKKENLDYEPCLLLIHGTTMVEVPVCRKYRADLEDTFPGEKHILLSGFIGRIPMEIYQKYSGSVLAPALTKVSGLGSGTCYYKETTWLIGNKRN